jgi:aerobic carbon-monoxide dehydrogenase large subunit
MPLDFDFSQSRHIGRPVRRIEDRALLTGRGKFVDDFHLPEMLHAHFVRSPVAHGRLLSVDVSAAREVPGVRAVYLYEDLVRHHTASRIPLAFRSKGLRFDVEPRVLAHEELTYVGEPVVMIVADSRAIAEDAGGQVYIEYDPLPVVVNAKAALRADSPRARTDVPDNLVAEIEVQFGDIAAAFASAAHVVKESFVVHKGGGHSIEGRCLLASYDEVQDLLTVWDANQMPHRARATIVQALGLSERQVRVVTPDVGGGFGPKGGFYQENLAVATAAMVLRVPVKWIEDRYENFLSCYLEHEQQWDVEAAYTREGKLLGVRGALYHDHGAHTPYGIAIPYNSATNFIGPYALPAYDLAIRLSLTNKVPCTATRGAGRSQGTFVMERLMDRAADQLGLSRDEIRRRNLITAEQMPYEFPVPMRDGSSMIYDSGDYVECQARALRIAREGFEERKAAARERGRLLGLGLANYVEGTGRGPYESGCVTVGESGSITVTTGATAQGQGTKTMLAQIVAEAFNMSVEKIHVIVGDTQANAMGLGAYASRQAVTAGNAVFEAAQKVVAKAKEAAAHILKVSVEDIEIRDGEALVRGSHQKLPLASLAKALIGVPGFAMPGGMKPGLAAHINFMAPTLTHSNGSHVAEVEVDPETGSVKLVHYVVVHDCGRIINPQGVDGQVLGGVAHGIGCTLFEWMRYDEQGQPQAVTYADYLLPVADVVPRITIEHMESPSPFNPLGSKGAGEAGTIGAPNAIVAAVGDALSDYRVFVTQLPLTPYRLLELIDRAAGNGAP